MNQYQDIDFARVENGALAGRFIARFWQPVALAKECAAGRAKRIKFLGEFYTLYRGEDGRPRMVQDRCPHRGTSLAYGWVEGSSIRCRYHGWKFGADGRGEEFPAESEAYARSVSIRSYPVREYLGIVFCYVGGGEPPEFPTFPELEDDSRGELLTQSVVLPYNYFQRIENDHDEAHIFFVHKHAFAKYGLTQIPKVAARETDHGLEVISTRPDGKQRIGYGFMPNILLRAVPIPQDLTKMSILLGWRVPIDDTSTLSVMVNRVGNYNRELNADAEDPAAIVERVMRCEMTLDEVDQNHPLLPIIQDTVALAGQGLIADRDAEHLGQSDKGIAVLRRIWARELRALRDGAPMKTWSRPADFVFGKEIADSALEGALA